MSNLLVGIDVNQHNKESLAQLADQLVLTVSGIQGVIKSEEDHRIRKPDLVKICKFF